MSIFKKLFAPDAVCTDLLQSTRTRVAHIEFTSRCNLRCVFCFASQPEYKGTDLNEETINDIIEVLKPRKPDVVSVNGHGETTVYKNWNIHCDRMLEAGMPLHVISNFSRRFSTAEVETLSRFSSIEISCDSSEPDLFKELRRGADLKNLALNILKVRAVAMKEKRDLPEISLSCVVSDRNVLDLVNYVSFGKALGVDHFNFCNLTKYPDLPGAINPKHVTEMPIDQMEKAEASMTNAFQFLKGEGIRYHVQQGLLDSLNQKLNELKASPAPPAVEEGEKEIPEPDKKEEPTVGTEASPGPRIDSAAKMETNITPVPETSVTSVPVNEPVPVSENEISTGETTPEDKTAHRYVSDRPESQTRDCIDPWEFMLIQSNRDVLPCCWHKPIHSLGISQSLEMVFNNSRIRELRRRLLTGDLSHDCLTCPSRGWTSTENLKKKVWKYLNAGLHKYIPLGIPEVKPDRFKEYPITYAGGWHGAESNKDIPDTDWQDWRWTTAKSVCELENPRKEAVLIFYGSVDKAVHEDQRVKVTLNKTLLDDFVPGTAKFCKEYVITPGMLGEEVSIPLVFETDKTFSPSDLNPEVDDNRQLGIQVYRLFFGEIE
ncbi:MAG: radical SAM protein [bacterium]|nr:radical SAM protein [bacterium]